MNKMLIEATLSSWSSLNEIVKNCNEKECVKLMEAESKGKHRKDFMLRIHSRLNKLRADRERKEIIKKCG